MHLLVGAAARVARVALVVVAGLEGAIVGQNEVIAAVAIIRVASAIGTSSPCRTDARVTASASVSQRGVLGGALEAGEKVTVAAAVAWRGGVGGGGGGGGVGGGGGRCGGWRRGQRWRASGGGGGEGSGGGGGGEGSGGVGGGGVGSETAGVEAWEEAR